MSSRTLWGHTIYATAWVSTSVLSICTGFPRTSTADRQRLDAPLFLCGYGNNNLVFLGILRPLTDEKLEKILVMMSTYNGEHFLRTQLDCIFQQVRLEVYLLVRDDGSTDDTVNILNSYRQQYPQMEVLMGENIGVIRSYYKLLDYAVGNYVGFKYFAFSDQDDFWYPEKLIRAVEKNVNNADNFFYHSCYEIADKNMNVITQSLLERSTGTLGEAIVSNPTIGFSEVFSYSILKNAAKISNYKLENEHYYPYHDLWVYLVAQATKATIVFDGYCGAIYRQHGMNVIGTGRSFLSTLTLQISNLLRTKNLKSGFAGILLDIIDVENDVYEILSKVRDYKKSWRNRLALMRDKNFRTNYMLRNLGFRFSVLIGLF